MYEPSNWTNYSIEKTAVSVILLSVLLLSGTGAFGDEPEPDSETKVALIVLDGADWKVIHRLNNQGRLPEIERTMEEGVYTNLSTPRAFSPVTWTKLATGQKTSDVGVKGWNSVNENGETRLIQSTDVENKRVWNYLNDHGISTGVVNYLLTWPVEPVKGFLIADTLARGHNQTYPSDFGNGSLKDMSEWEKADYVLDNHKKDVSFLALGFKRLDGISHHMWKFVEPEAFGREKDPENQKYRELVYTEYENLDEVLSRFDDSWNVIVVSDSGFQPEGHKEPGDISPTNAFNLDPLIEKMGYAEFNTEITYGQKIYRIDKENSQLQREIFRYPTKPEINSTHYRFKLRILDENLDINQTIRTFENVEYPDGEEFFFDLEYVEKEEDYNQLRGKYMLRPDKMNDTRITTDYINHPTMPEPIIHVENAVKLQMPDGEVFKWWSEAEQSGDHPPGTDGIFLARGPAIRDKGRLGGDVGVVDVAPTILYMYGLPVPEDMEGRPVTKIFTPEFNNRREIRNTDIATLRNESRRPTEVDPQAEKAIKQRLKDLGYSVW